MTRTRASITASSVSAGRFGYQFINSDKRLTKPLVRKNGKLEEAGWDEALELVAGRLKDAGAASAALATARLTNEELVVFKQLMETAGTDNYRPFSRLRPCRA